MIARHLPIKNNYKSSAQGLVSYLMNTQENSHRVLDFSITNCLGITSDDEEAITAEEVHLAAREMIAVQCMNSSAKSAKMYHLLVSFKDDPDKATLHNIEQELCEALGFKDFVLDNGAAFASMTAFIGVLMIAYLYAVGKGVIVWHRNPSARR